MDGDSPRVQAVGSAFVRTLPVLPFWVLRLAAQGWDPALVSPWTLMWDLCLVAGHTWAIVPVARYQGKDFADNRRLSSIFLLPIVWSAAVAIRDLYFYFTGKLL